MEGRLLSKRHPRPGSGSDGKRSAPRDSGSGAARGQSVRRDSGAGATRQAGKAHRAARPSEADQRLQAIFDIARDLTASLAAEDRYERLLAAVRRAIPADAACLMRLEGDELVPLAAHGLTEEARVRRYARHRHPRLDIILRHPGPVRFPPDSDIPDPFDGMLMSDPHALSHIHACLGCALVDGGEVVGALTADALAPHAFDHLPDSYIAALGALAAAAMRTTRLFERLEHLAARREAVARELQAAAAQSSGGEILGQSPAIRRLLENVDLVARSDLPVLITGETGVGKELVARRIHQGSSRRDEAMIHVNCAALPELVAESELFGHVAGAFTGAVRDRAGKFEIANGGTLFLDEIGELPLALQPKLLRALQEKEIQRVGSDRVHHVDVRVIAATNRNLEREAAEGRFRADLYHRLAVYPIRVPALRERPEDILMLAAFFLDRARRRLGAGPLRLTEEARTRLVQAPWPGNVRELENVISRAALRGAGRTTRPVAAASTVDPSAGAPAVNQATAGGSAAPPTPAPGRGAGDRGGPPSPPGTSPPVPVPIGVELLDLSPMAPGGPPLPWPAVAGSALLAAGQTASGDAAAFDSIHGRPFDPAASTVLQGTLRERTDAFQRAQILEAVARHEGNWAAAARDLGMHRSNLHHLANRLGLRE